MNQLYTYFLIGAALLIVNSTAVFAQNNISAGINAGAGISSLYGNGYGANKLHAHIGIPVNFEINKNLGFQATTQLSSMGYASSFYKPTERMKLYYMDLVATLKYFPYKIAFIGGGLHASGLLNSQYRYLAYSNDYYGEPDISAIVNKFDYGPNESIYYFFGGGGMIDAIK